MSNSLSENKDAWTAEMLRLRREIMHDPCAHAVITLAEHMFREYDTEIARLKAGLDEIKGTSVVHFYETAMSADTLADIPHLLDEYYASEPTGTIARATDTGREWVKLTLGWMAV